MKNLHPRFLLLYFGLVSIVLISEQLHLVWTFYLTKPLVVFSLLLYFTTMSRDTVPKSIKRAIISGLAMSMIGDIFLMFENEGPHWFMFGLVSFLIAHICYIIAFSLDIYRTRPGNYEWGQLAFAALVLVYGAEFFIINRKMFGDLMIPVFIYCIAITVMGIVAIMRKKNVNRSGYYAIITGATFFIISDSLLATEKFVHPVFLSEIVIKVTYFIAQLLITGGILSVFARRRHAAAHL